MGGFGSGRPREHPRAGESFPLRVRDVRAALRAADRFGYETREALEWRTGRRVAAALEFIVSAAPRTGIALELNYRIVNRFVSEPIALTTTAQRLGGRRWWFGCPACGRRCAVLFAPERRWVCGRCCKISYR